MTTVLENVAAVSEETQCPEPTRIIRRERRWNRVSARYEEYTVTPEMLEQSRRREEYCREFGVYA